MQSLGGYESVSNCYPILTVSKFGHIVSARIMRNEQGQSRGFGFVSFQTPDEGMALMKSMGQAGLILFHSLQGITSNERQYSGEQTDCCSSS